MKKFISILSVASVLLISILLMGATSENGKQLYWSET